jgi:hypothetical protein
MNPDNTNSHADPGPTLPLPNQGRPKQDNDQTNPAVELVRQKVQDAYTGEPDAATEAVEIAELGPAVKRSKHQQFMYDLTNSGKSLAEIQEA